MFFAGIDAHTRYVVVVIINKMGERGSAASAALRPLRLCVKKNTSRISVHRRPKMMKIESDPNFAV